MRTSRTGALALAVAGLTGLTGLTSCSTVPARAATVDDSVVRRSDFERDLRELSAHPGLLDLTGGTEFSIAGDTARGWLNQVITWTAAEDLLEEAGLEPTQQSIDDIRAQISSNPTAQDLVQDMQDDVVRGAASVESLSQIPAPTAEELEAKYNDRPASTGALCVSHILVDTQAEAEDVLAELAAGADFAELAGQRSTEPNAAETGGALAANDGNPCQSVGTFQTSFDRDFTAGALAATAGEPTGPVQTQFGYHVILARPFDEVGEDLAALVATAPGDAALSGRLATADITVDPRYGRWDAARGSVVSLR
jgi:parvulin-like peptidyl-prolyl isomerase